MLYKWEIFFTLVYQGRVNMKQSISKNNVKSKAQVRLSPTKTAVSKIKIVAQVDIGFGNYLYLRGDGCGLSWDKGVVMTPAADDRWEWECVCPISARGFEFKFLINDSLWSTGDNYVAVGQENIITPTF